VVGAVRAEFADESRWRDVLYVAIDLPLVAIEFIVTAVAWVAALTLTSMPIWYDLHPAATLPTLLGWLGGHEPLLALGRFVVGVALLPIAASLSQLAVALHRPVVVGLLGTSESRELQRQVESLRESRSAALDTEAAELRRIERDLHDGAQQRLVRLALDLGLAGEKSDSDPEAAKRLVLEGRTQAQQALGELRDLVRGLAPSILHDRGLVAALDSIAGRSPVPTTVRSELTPGERLPDAVERAGYFVVAEALANLAKHSGATHCEVRCLRKDGRIVIEVEDDGAGGAAIVPGGGLAGLARRVEAVDGTFTVSSPPGGPTVVRAEMPV
jgi:signal transduction histidine kinase